MKNEPIKGQSITIDEKYQPMPAFPKGCLAEMHTYGPDLNQLMEDQARIFSQKHEEFILKALEKHGHTFQSAGELEDFARKRCHMVEDLQTKLKTLYVDKTPVCEWESTPVTVVNPDPMNYTVESYIKARIL